MPVSDRELLVAKEKFKNSFDWNKMTEQDLSVWEEIIKVLKDA